MAVRLGRSRGRRALRGLTLIGGLGRRSAFHRVAISALIGRLWRGGAFDRFARAALIGGLRRRSALYHGAVAALDGRTFRDRLRRCFLHGLFYRLLGWFGALLFGRHDLSPHPVANRPLFTDLRDSNTP